jgi:hypothetical protein
MVTPRYTSRVLPRRMPWSPLRCRMPGDARGTRIARCPDECRGETAFRVMTVRDVRGEEVGAVVVRREKRQLASLPVYATEGVFP